LQDGPHSCIKHLHKLLTQKVDNKVLVELMKTKVDWNAYNFGIVGLQKTMVQDKDYKKDF